MERRGRLPTEPGPGGHTSPLISSPIKSPPPPREHLHEDPPFKGNLRLLSQNIVLSKSCMVQSGNVLILKRFGFPMLISV